eukprot:GHRQ01029093.1.p1 GENE.GHRQ01029093.1~~GHRQ01029093.1.p1  ORF type:complete len:107 (+),score=24.26 GHRQ01029093.1:515-835(+)
MANSAPVSPYVSLIDQGVDQLQGPPPDADISILHAVYDGGAMALHRLRVHSDNLAAGSSACRVRGTQLKRQHTSSAAANYTTAADYHKQTHITARAGLLFWMLLAL